MARQLITTFGGTGFVGRAIIRALCKQGYRVRACVRNPQKARRLRALGEPGQVELIQGNLRYPESLPPACEDADIVINCAGLLYEKGKQSFEALHVDGAEEAARAARDAGVKRFIHISAIGASQMSRSSYARSKGRGEEHVRQVFPGAIVLRPSIVIGEEDSFFNRFGAMAASLRLIPLIGGGHMRMQPICVSDLVRAVLAAMTRDDSEGRTFELGGPRIYSFKELMQIVVRETGQQPVLLPIPYAAFEMLAATAEAVTRFSPFAPPITLDQIRMLKTDNVVTLSVLPEVASIRALGVTELKSVEAVAANYLQRFRPRAQFDAKAAPVIL